MKNMPPPPNLSQKKKLENEWHDLNESQNGLLGD